MYSRNARASESADCEGHCSSAKALAGCGKAGISSGHPPRGNLERAPTNHTENETGKRAPEEEAHGARERDRPQRRWQATLTDPPGSKGAQHAIAGNCRPTLRFEIANFEEGRR